MPKLLRSLPRLLCLALLAAPATAWAQGDQQNLVDRATLTIQEVVGDPAAQVARDALARARAVMVCPRLFKAGFLFGGEGGGCVLVARDGAGSWSSPAFFGMGGGSVGLQIGIQDSEMVMMIETERGLSAIMDSQFKLGADASIAVATVGAGVEGATTAAFRADIVAFEHSRGLFAGASVQGSILATDTNANRLYYGQDLAARQIVMQMQANNPGADPLRAVLTRYGSPTPVAYAAPPPAYAPMPQGAVRATPLAPPR
jgi:lipid-binding SYLF domain-containing protein